MTRMEIWHNVADAASVPCTMTPALVLRLEISASESSREQAEPDLNVADGEVFLVARAQHLLRSQLPEIQFPLCGTLGQSSNATNADAWPPPAHLPPVQRRRPASV